MKFEEALLLLRKGKKVRCTWWIQNSYIFIRHGHLMYMSSLNEEGFIQISGYDMINGDWEVLE